MEKIMKGGGKVSNLTDKQMRFAQEYWLSGNGTQSAITAGYSKKTAYSQAHALLKKPEIQEEIQKNRAEAENALRQQFSRDAMIAREIMFNIMKNDKAPEAVRLSAAKDFLDRAGYKPVERQELNASIQTNKLEDILTQLKEDDDR